MDKNPIYRIINTFIIMSVTSFVIFSCDTGATEVKTSDVSPERKGKDTIVRLKEEKKEPALVIKYDLDSISTKARLNSFQNKYTPEEKHLIFALNRVDAGRLNQGDILVVPDTLTGNFMDYSPFPRTLQILNSIPKTILISQRIQGIALYEDSKLVRWGPVSSGKRSTPTPNGLHYGNYKASKKVSTVNPDWLMPFYFNFMNYEGVGVHEYSMPGYPASHACVRLRKEDATFVYSWAQQWELNKNGQIIIHNGTPFMVFGKYDFDKPFPWLRLAQDPNDNFLTQEEMDTLKNYVSRYFKDERNFIKTKTPENELILPVVNDLETIK